MQRVLLVDDHQMFREALRLLLEKSPQFEVVGECASGLEVLPLARQTRPDIVCMDIGLPDINGIEATRLLREAFPTIKVLALSVFTEPRYVTDMMRAGAMAYVTKHEASTEFLRALDAIRCHREYFSPAVAGVLAGAVRGDLPSAHGASALGARERQVLQLVAEGHTSTQIADCLHIAASTVDVHRRNIMRKLELHSVAELTRFAIRHGLTQG